MIDTVSFDSWLSIPLEDRLAIPIEWSEIDYNLDGGWFPLPPNLTIDEIGWDLHRLDPDGLGFDFLMHFMTELGDPRYCLGPAVLESLWDRFDRPRTSTDRLIVDVLAYARSEHCSIDDNLKRKMDRTASDLRWREMRARGIKRSIEYGEAIQLFEAAQRAVTRFPAAFPIDRMSDVGRTAFDLRCSTPARAFSKEQMHDFAEFVFECLEAHNMTTEYATLPEAVKLSAEKFEMEVRRAINAERPLSGWIMDSKGKADHGHPENVRLLIRWQANMQLRENLWTEQIEHRHEVSAETWSDWTPMNDKIVDSLMTWGADLAIPFRPTKEFFLRTVRSVARENAFDPVLTEIARLQSGWDGVPRLDTWLTHACGVPDDAYHRVVGLNIIGGMVRRARHPGCKHDECAILISPEQGTGKSTLCKILAMNERWHIDTLKLGGRPQDMLPQLAGKLVVELQELSGMKKTDVEDVKAFISTQFDNYTKKYEAFANDHARRCIFIATSNDSAPLRDRTGNRRFLPVHVMGEVNLDWMRANIEQLIGEAAARESCGEAFDIPREVWSDAQRHQNAALQRPEYEIILEEWLANGGLPAFVTAADLSQVVREAAGRPISAAEYGHFVRAMGFTNVQKKIDGKNVNVWHRGDLKGAMRIKPVMLHQRGVRYAMDFDPAITDHIDRVPVPMPPVGGRVG